MLDTQQVLHTQLRLQHQEACTGRILQAVWMPTCGLTSCQPIALRPRPLFQTGSLHLRHSTVKSSQRSRCPALLWCRSRTVLHFGAESVYSRQWTLRLRPPLASPHSHTNIYTHPLCGWGTSWGAGGGREAGLQSVRVQAGGQGAHLP